MNYKECPRCQTSWKDWNKQITFYVCKNCDLRYYCGLEEWLVVLNIIVNGDQLNWDFRTNICHYIYNSSLSDLPWLPFDITTTRLKKLILFS